MKFSIIATGYNCESYAKECIESVLNQTYKNWELLIYNDASTDLTEEICEPYTDSKNVWLMTSKENLGALYGRYHLTRLATGDVVCFLGLDDSLPLNALEIIAKNYDQDTQMTYGSFETDGYVYLAKEYSREVWENKSFRRSKWEATALNTFRRELLLSVPKEKLMRNGKFLDNCTDLAYSFPCLESVTKDQCKAIREITYIYRKHNNNTLNRLGIEHKADIREYLKTI